MDSNLKVVIITGGASGLGLASAKKFVEKGLKTIIIGRNEQNLIETAKDLGELCCYKK
jgi:short-subunit dehydrogenase involved in D-alanine esterification of teichoic acids